MNRTLGAAPAGRFDTTSWSLVLAAADRDAPEASAALAELCERYWYPVYAFIRRSAVPREEAEDLTQSFFERLLSTEWLRRARRDRGRFRSFLLTSVKYFVANERDAARTRKRGGDHVHVPIDFEGAEARFVDDAGTGADPETLYARRWAVSVLEEALLALRRDLERSGQAGHVETLTPFLTGEAERGDYARAAARLQSTEGAVRVAVHRLRTAFRQHLRSVVARTVPKPYDVDDEIRSLIAALSS